MLSFTDEGNWRLLKRPEKSISLWASVSEQPKQVNQISFPLTYFSEVVAAIKKCGDFHGQMVKIVCYIYVKE